MNSILTSSELSIRGNCIDLQKSYIFTAAKDGQICVLDLNMPEKEIGELEIKIKNTKLLIR